MAHRIKRRLPVFSTFVKTLLDDTTAAAFLTTLGVSSFVQTLLDDASAAAFLTTLGITVNSYTPTLTNTTNVDSSTANTTYYVNIGNKAVIVWGIVGIDATAAASTLSDMGMSLPVVSALGASTQLGGSATAADLPSSIRIVADATNDRARFQWVSQSASNLNFGFIFGYPIL